jgi:hypothetical protein
VHAGGGIVNVTVEKDAVIGVKHDLADGGAGAFRHNPIHNALALGHPRARKPHGTCPNLPALIVVPQRHAYGHMPRRLYQKTREIWFIQRPFTSINVNNQAKLGLNVS